MGKSASIRSSRVTTPVSGLTCFRKRAAVARDDTVRYPPPSKDVAQFARNFTVYVLPPDVVCLYSEDRKFFLHGELYCALA
jgi:hypothetical protein